MINILVAHHAEARPFCDHYGLTEARHGGLSLFCTGSVRLLVTGQGAVPVSQSLSMFWHSVTRSRHDYWLNFGVAGSAAMTPGTLVMVNAVCPGAVAVDRCSAQFPDHQPDCRKTRSHCLSVDKPVSTYPQQGVVDMEAATIGKLLSELKVVDRLVVLKLVSDGPDALPGNRAAMRTLIDHAAPAVCAVSDMILSLHPTRPD